MIGITDDASLAAALEPFGQGRWQQHLIRQAVVLDQSEVVVYLPEKAADSTDHAVTI